MEKTTYEKLSAINVNDKVEKKNGLTYLSWAWAWAEVKKVCPDATYQVIADKETNKPYFYDENLGYLVMTEVTIEGETTTVTATTTIEPELATLKKGTDSWDKVVNYVTTNKALGLETIGKQLNRKYVITPALKKEIANLIEL